MSDMSSLDDNDVSAILDGMVDGVITINDKGIILSFNKSAETMFGYERSEIIGQNVNSLMPSPDHQHHNEYINHYTSSGEAHIIGIGRDVTALRKNGEEFPMRLSVTEYPTKVEGERWFIGSCLDITLQKKQEEQLRQSMKMEALGKLTGGISHDYNNMLGIMLGYAGLLVKRFPDNPVVVDYAMEIISAGERSKNLTQKLLSFSRGHAEKKELVNMNEVLADDAKMLEKMLTAHINLEIKLDDELWLVFIDKGCLEDAILNMSINAMHAMPEGGVLKFETSNTQIGSLDAQVLNIDQGDYVKLSVTDTGIGMSEDIRTHIFEPFFTTKEDKGTGLGLSQVYAFVENSGGTIRAYSELGHGTSFSIYFPQSVSKQDQSVMDKQSGSAGIHGGSESILVVDDEQVILDLTMKMLEPYGYNIICVSSGKQALEMLDKEKFDLVLSDVIMPDMDGFELAYLIKCKFPNMKIQLSSGLSENHGKTVTNDCLHRNILKKPFTGNELLQCVNKIFDE